MQTGGRVGKTFHKLTTNTALLCDGDGSPRIRVSTPVRGHVGFEPLLPNGQGSATFTCSGQDALMILQGGAVQIVNEHGHMILRCSDNLVWMVYVIPAAEVSDSCLIDPEHFSEVVSQVLTD